jgi:phytoene synthase
VDEARDEQSASAAVDEWRREVGRVFGSESPRSHQALSLKPVVERFQLSRQPLDDLVSGVEMDLHRSRYATFDELADYCRHVASAVGLMCVEVFGCRDHGSRDYAINLGLALQLTNIIRDVRVDLASDRIYLPQEDLDRFGVDEAMLRAGRVTAPVRELLEFECRRARELFAAAAQSLPACDAPRLLAAEIMGGIYFEILQRIERNGYDVFSSVIRVPKPQRAFIALTIWARQQFAALMVRSSARA